METLYKSQWVTQETVPSGHIHLHSGLMAQPALGRAALPEERKIPLGLGTGGREELCAWGCCFRGCRIGGGALVWEQKVSSTGGCHRPRYSFGSPDITALL